VTNVLLGWPDSFVNDDINIDLIDQIISKAFEILSKSITTSVFKAIQETIDATRIQTGGRNYCAVAKIKNYGWKERASS
jgi:hypothetical protein